MAKANPVTGGSIWLPAGAEPPEGWTEETGPRLTGPGGEAAMQRHRETARAGESADQPDGLPMEAEQTGTGTDAVSRETVDGEAGQREDQGERADGGGDAEQLERPAGNASADAWRNYVAKMEGADPGDEVYAELTRTQLQDRADSWGAYEQ